MNNIIVTTQIEGVSFNVNTSELARSMTIPVTWENSRLINRGVLNKTLFDKLEYMIVNLDIPECCDDERSYICSDLREEEPQRYISGRIDDKTIEFILGIAK